MTDFIAIGTVLGLSAGLSPGPLLALVISETVRHDIKAGIKVAVSPFFTDLPIIVLTFLLLSQISGSNTFLGLISLVGGLVVLSMGYETLKQKPPEFELTEKKVNSLSKGILVNVLSPHPYLFWLSVGGPIMSKAMDRNITASAAFLVSFYSLLVGSKIFLAVLVGKSKSFLAGRWYVYLMRLLGIALCVLALLLFRDGLNLLGFTGNP